MERDHRFLCLLEYYADLDLAFPDIKDGIGGVAPGKYFLVLPIVQNAPAAVR
jgi:hypothetical protein